jgi:hypothetical protein
VCEGQISLEVNWVSRSARNHLLHFGSRDIGPDSLYILGRIGKPCNSWSQVPLTFPGIQAAKKQDIPFAMYEWGLRGIGHGLEAANRSTGHAGSWVRRIT